MLNIFNIFNPSLFVIRPVFISAGEGENEKKWGYEFSTEFISIDGLKQMIIDPFNDRGINLILCLKEYDHEVGLLTFKAI